MASESLLVREEREEDVDDCVTSCTSLSELDVSTVLIFAATNPLPLPLSESSSSESSITLRRFPFLVFFATG